MAIKSIFHVNVNCSDLERSRAFYERLGFQTVNELPTGGSPKLALGLGLPNCEGRATIMILDPGQPQQARLDLIEWVEPRDPEAPYSHLGHLGINRIALWTEGIDEEYKRLCEAGVEMLSEPVQMGNQARFFCMKDPDGTIIELIEVLR